MELFQRRNYTVWSVSERFFSNANSSEAKKEEKRLLEMGDAAVSWGRRFRLGYGPQHLGEIVKEWLLDICSWTKEMAREEVIKLANRVTAALRSRAAKKAASTRKTNAEKAKKKADKQKQENDQLKLDL